MAKGPVGKVSQSAGLEDLKSESHLPVGKFIRPGAKLRGESKCRFFFPCGQRSGAGYK